MPRSSMASVSSESIPATSFSMLNCSLSIPSFSSTLNLSRLAFCSRSISRVCASPITATSSRPAMSHIRILFHASFECFDRHFILPSTTQVYSLVANTFGSTTHQCKQPEITTRRDWHHLLIQFHFDMTEGRLKDLNAAMLNQKLPTTDPKSN